MAQYDKYCKNILRQYGKYLKHSNPRRYKFLEKREGDFARNRRGEF